MRAHTCQMANAQLYAPRHGACAVPHGLLRILQGRQVALNQRHLLLQLLRVVQDLLHLRTRCSKLARAISPLLAIPRCPGAGGVRSTRAPPACAGRAPGPWGCASASPACAPRSAPSPPARAPCLPSQRPDPRPQARSISKVTNLFQKGLDSPDRTIAAGSMLIHFSQWIPDCSSSSSGARTLLSSTPTAATAPTAWVCVVRRAYDAPTSRHPVITFDPPATSNTPSLLNKLTAPKIHARSKDLLEMPVRKNMTSTTVGRCALRLRKKNSSGARTTATTERRCGAAMRVSTIMGSIARSNADANPGRQP